MEETFDCYTTQRQKCKRLRSCLPPRIQKSVNRSRALIKVVADADPIKRITVDEVVSMLKGMLQ